MTVEKFVQIWITFGVRCLPFFWGRGWIGGRTLFIGSPAVCDVASPFSPRNLRSSGGSHRAHALLYTSIWRILCVRIGNIILYYTIICTHTNERRGSFFFFFSSSLIDINCFLNRRSIIIWARVLGLATAKKNSINEAVLLLYYTRVFCVPGANKYTHTHTHLICLLVCLSTYVL